jgi:hypothetical protein
MSIQSDKMVFYYMSRENLCFLCLTEEAYPKRLAFLYLEEVADTLLQEMVREYGNGVRTTCTVVFLVLYYILHRIAQDSSCQLSSASHSIMFFWSNSPSRNNNHSGAKLSTRRLDPFSLYITILLFNESSENLGIKVSTKIIPDSMRTCPRFSPL